MVVREAAAAPIWGPSFLFVNGPQSILPSFKKKNKQDCGGETFSLKNYFYYSYSMTVVIAVRSYMLLHSPYINI